MFEPSIAMDFKAKTRYFPLLSVAEANGNKMSNLQTKKSNPILIAFLATPLRERI